MTCTYAGCCNSSKDHSSSLSFFAVPHDARRAIWQKHAGVPEMHKLGKAAKVCELHFHESQLKEYALQKRLLRNAFPLPISFVKCGCDHRALSPSCAKLLEYLSSILGDSTKENARWREQNQMQKGQKQQGIDLQKMTLTGDYIPLDGKKLPSPVAGPSTRKRSREIKSELDDSDDDILQLARAKVQRMYTRQIPHTVISTDAPKVSSVSPQKSPSEEEEVGECDSTTQNEGEKEILMELLKMEEEDPLDCSDVIEVASYVAPSCSKNPNAPKVEVIPVPDGDEAKDDPADDSVIFVKQLNGPGPPKTIKLTPIPKKLIKMMKKKKSPEAQKTSPATPAATCVEPPAQPTTQPQIPTTVIDLDDTTESPEPPGPTRTRRKSPKKAPGKIRVAKQKDISKDGEKKPRFVVLDGSNVAFHHSIMKKVFSVEGLKIAIDYFEAKGHECVAVVPMFRSKARYSTNPALLKDLNLRGKVIFSPSKNINGFSLSSYDDLLVMQVAEANQGVIISNDNFADLLGQNIAWDTIIGTRVVGFTWFKDQFFIPLDPYGRDGPKINDILYF